MSRVLVTEGTGFIGGHIVDSLLEEGNGVVVVDNLSSSTGNNLNGNATFIQGGIRDNLDAVS